MRSVVLTDENHPYQNEHLSSEWHLLHLKVLGIPEWCRTVGAGFTETLLPSLWVQVCAAMQRVGWGLVCSTLPLPPCDMAGYMWLSQGNHESRLQLSGLLLCIACLQEQGKAWLAQLRGHQHCFWACVKKQSSNKITGAL